MLLHSDMGSFIWAVGGIFGGKKYHPPLLLYVMFSWQRFLSVSHCMYASFGHWVRWGISWNEWDGREEKYGFIDSLEAKDTEIMLENILNKDSLCLYLVACLCFLQVPRYLFWYLSRKPWFRKPVMYYGEWLKWVIFLGLCLFWWKTGFIFGGNNTTASVWNTVNGVVEVHWSQNICL